MNGSRPKTHRWSLIAGMMACLLFPQLSQAQGQTENEFWPEMDFFYRFDAQWRLYALTAMSHARDIQYTDWQIAAHLDFSFFPLEPLIKLKTVDYERFRVFLLRAGYFYAQAVGENSGNYLENRGIVEAAIRIPLTELLLFSDKNRVDLRDINGAFSVRYRNRIRLERQTETALVTFNPILSVELFYDSRYRAWNRQLYNVSIEWTLSGTVLLETAYQRQNDSQPRVRAVNAWGLTLSLFY